MPDTLSILQRAAELRDAFVSSGAQVVEADVLLSADTLLDLYGEDIRGRSYLTQDPLLGEMVMRPDFTVPVVQKHMETGAEPARYTYAGPVFRKQDSHPDRANEYIQVGFEVFDGENPADADAEVFAAIADAVASLPVRAATGDIGLLIAAVRGLQTSDARKAALLRHLWRPKRFRALLDRFCGQSVVPPTRAALLAAADPFEDALPDFGLRRRSEVVDRIEALRADAAEPPISKDERGLIDAILALRETLPNVISALRDIAVDLPSISEAVERLKARSAALATRGVDIDSLDFEGSYGRTSLEYYDGFVFGFYATKTPGLPPIATGGRYDALTAQLGQGRGVPAVGAVIRPDLMLTIAGGR